MIPSIEYNYFLWFAKYKNIFPSFFWIEILKIVIFSLFGKFRSRSWIDSWQNFQNDSFMFLCVLLCFVHDMDTIWIDLIKSRSLNSVDLSLPFKGMGQGVTISFFFHIKKNKYSGTSDRYFLLDLSMKFMFQPV